MSFAPETRGRRRHWAGAIALSALLHAALALGLLEVYRDLGARPGEAREAPEIQVTSLVLDAVSISNLPGAEAATVAPEVAANTPEAATPDLAYLADPAEPDLAETEPPEAAETPQADTAEAADAEIAEAEAAEAAERAEAERLAEAEPDTLAAAEAARLAGAEAERLEAAAPDSLADAAQAAEPLAPVAPLSPVAPVSAATPAPAEMAPLSPIRAENAAQAAIAPVNRPAQGVQPVGRITGTPERVTALAPAAAAPRIAPAAGPGASRAIAPRATMPERTSLPRPPGPQPNDADVTDPSAGRALTELIARIRGHDGADCLLALPQLRNGADPELVIMAASESAIRDFMAEVFAGASDVPEQRNLLVDGRQCPALEYLRGQPAYPAFRLALSIDAREIASGTNLAGSLSNAAGRYLSLLLVDDNGVVQDLGPYVTFSGGRAAFSVPLTRNGPARDTSQLLLAVATPGRPPSVEREAGKLAEDFFPALDADTGDAASFALIPFDVR